MRHRFLLLISLVVFSFYSCSKHENQIVGLSALEGGKIFAVPTGTMADQFVLQRFPDAKIKYFNSVIDCAMAVKDGKADAACYDKPVLKNIAAKNDGLTVLSEVLVDDKYGFAVQLSNPELKSAIDSVLKVLKSDGTYDDMMMRWFPEKGSPQPMPALTFNDKNGVIRFGTAAVTEPMSFYDASHKVVGFDIEFASRVAIFLGKKIEIVDMEFGAMLPALISGKVDMIGAGISITEERAKKVLFSESYYPSGIAALVREFKQPAEEVPSAKLEKLEDIRDKKIGVLIGSIHDKFANRDYPDADIMTFQSESDIITALKSNKVDVAFADHIALKEVFSKNPDLTVFAANVYSAPIAAAFNSENDVLREKFNIFLKEIKANGVYADMTDRWMEKGDTDMPEITGEGKNGILKVGVFSDGGLPSTIRKDNRLVGFDVELPARFAAWLGKKFVPVDIPFASMLASLSTNKIDVVTCQLMITEEREKQVDFSDPYYESGISLYARKDNIENSGAGQSATTDDAGKHEPSFLKKITESFYNNIIVEKRYLLILDGLKLTILISIFSALFGSIIGGLVCFMRMSRRKILSSTAKIYISLLRGTPVLVLLMIIYYVVFASVNINPAIVAVFAFGLNFGAYVSEMFRTSIESIDVGQKEAGIAGGFTKVQTFIHIIMPQALRQVLPVYKGEFISLVKMTSIVGYIAVQDLTKASDIIRSRTFDAFFPLIMAAVLYLIIAWLLTWALGYVELSVDPKRKRSSKVKEVAQ
jgi:polar amino acid transport system substrate-binding protein